MAEAFKESINPQVVRDHAAALSQAWPDFPHAAFVAHACEGLEQLELKDRVRHVAGALRQSLPEPFPTASRILCDALPPPLPDASAVSSTFSWWPFLQVVEEHGAGHPEAALDALERMTQTFTGEWAVRPLIEAHPEATLARMLAWTQHPSVHVRRLASEGSRPRLPWGQRLTAIDADPSLTAPILHALRDDPELYVRRSVANHLGDVAKAHPEYVVGLAKDWMVDASEDRAWLVRHALRFLVKQGHSGALAVLGYTAPDLSDVQVSVTPDRISLGDSVTVALSAVSHTAGPLMMDFVMTRPVASGTSTLPFKGKDATVKRGQKLRWSKRLPIRAVTTRTWYAGEHSVDVVLNGRVVGTATFVLDVPG